MEAVPSLCATGTVGVAVVGFAFGHPQHSDAVRPRSKNKRRAPTRTSVDSSDPRSTLSSTPSPLPHSSAPPSRLRKRISHGRPLTALGNLRGGLRTMESTPDGKIRPETAGGNIPLQDQAPQQPTVRGSFAFEFKGSENVDPSWSRGVPTGSSLKNQSSVGTSAPGSPSVAYSSGSTDPILPALPQTPNAVSRNKLVKRSSSQRALHGHSPLHSTLRRPATSHQRSATLQRHFFRDEEPIQRPLFFSSPLPADLPEDPQTYDDTLQRWRPFFKAPKLSKDGSSKRRNFPGRGSRNTSPNRIVPDITELPTLLMATSISTRSSEEHLNGGVSNMSGLSRPSTPFSLSKLEPLSAENAQPDTTIGSVPRPRTPFSISEMFPSPSPSTWKLPRSGSVRNKMPFARYPAGRRVVSAPQSMQPDSFTPEDTVLGNHTHIYASTEALRTHTASAIDPNAQFQTSPSQLPPLNPMSPLEVDIPDMDPFFPPSPQLESSFASPSSSPSLPSSFGQAVNRNKAHRPSGAPSASTLLGSDNDNSRLMSGDEDDDTDGLSETIYDSTRTGATHNSHSAAKWPPIDTIFDESPPPELSSNEIPDTSERSRIDQSMRALRDPSPPDLSNLSEASVSCKERSGPTSEADNFALPRNSFNSPTQPLTASASSTVPYEDMDRDEEDELWSFGSVEEKENASYQVTPKDDESPLARVFPRPKTITPRRRHSPPTGSQNSKSNIFEWSEQANVDRETPPGDSPRPKTVHGRQGKELRGSRLSGRRGLSALHLRSQSVPVPNDNRSHSNATKLDSWVLGSKGPSEDWDEDFDFEEPSRATKQTSSHSENVRLSMSSGMVVPRAILERQASVHGQFGQVKDLTRLVEQLKNLQQQASAQGLLNGQSAELWKEAEGIINLATLDDEEPEPFPPRSPQSPTADFGFFDEESPSIRNRLRSGFSPPPKEDQLGVRDESSSSQHSPRPSQDLSTVETPPPSARPRKDSTAKAKSVLETIHQQRSHYDPGLLDSKHAQKKLPFDTTSLKDLVTRAGVVTRALKEELRRAGNREHAPATPEARPSTPPDPPFSHMFQKPAHSPPFNKSPRVTQSPKSPKSPKNTSIGGSIASNDNEINGHMKIMTVV